MEATDGDGVDLSLSLSIGGGCWKATSTAAGEVGESAPPSQFQASEGRMGMRRQWEVWRMRREEKQQGKPTSCSPEDRAALEAQEVQSRAVDRKVREGEWFLSRKCRSLETREISKNAGTAAHFPPVRYSPVVKATGMGVPCWAPAIAAADMSRQMPSSTVSNQSVNGGKDSVVKAASSSSTSSPGSSASCVSVHCTGSMQGGSSDARSNSSNVATEKKSAVHLMAPTLRTPTEDEAVDKLASTTAQSSFLSNSNTLQPVSKELQAVPSLNKPLFTSQNHMGKSLPSLLPQMPCVATTGKGPDGRTITGFLYRYSESEVSIVCVCHGTSFSPAEFVKHAGGTDISHPLRQIVVVVPS